MSFTDLAPLNDPPFEVKLVKDVLGKNWRDLARWHVPVEQADRYLDDLHGARHCAARCWHARM